MIKSRKLGISALSTIAVITILLSACKPQMHDVIIRGGTIYDGSGGQPLKADLAMDNDRISAIGDLTGQKGRLEIDATGMAVAPGFINMLSWANDSLIQDGRSMSDIRQGVTLEVMGEGTSMGPISPSMREDELASQSDIKFDLPWTTLGEYLQFLEDRGVSTNIASFVGASTVRIHELGYDDRQPTAEELKRMQDLVRQAMEEGAMGLGSSLPYIPAPFASTDELVALTDIVAEYNGMYISHIRNEGDEVIPSVKELIEIARRTGASAEIYHLKVSHKRNYDKLDEVIQLVEDARAEGLAISADIYTYDASSTGLNYDLPAWVKEGGHDKMIERLQDPALRERIIAETDMIPPEDLLLVSFRNPALRDLTGKTLAEVAAMRGTPAVATAMDLIVEDDSRVGTVRFTMSADNIRKKVAIPWVSISSDAGSVAPEPPFTNSQPHPRTYGSFARLLAKYVREENVISLQDAVYRMSGLPATNLKLDQRGFLKPGYYADVVVFDPKTVQDNATYQDPHQLATGVMDVFVNGQQVIKDQQHTGAMPGRFIKGPGWKKAP